MILVQGVILLLGLIFWIWGAVIIFCWLYFIVLGILMIPVMILEGLGNIWDWIWKGRKA